MSVTRAVDVNGRTVTPSSEEFFVQERGEVACAHGETRPSLCGWWCPVSVTLNVRVNDGPMKPQSEDVVVQESAEVP